MNVTYKKEKGVKKIDKKKRKQEMKHEMNFTYKKGKYESVWYFPFFVCKIHFMLPLF